MNHNCIPLCKIWGSRVAKLHGITVKSMVPYKRIFFTLRVALSAYNFNGDGTLPREIASILKWRYTATLHCMTDWTSLCKRGMNPFLFKTTIKG